MIFTLVLRIFSSHKYGQDTVGSLASLVQECCLIASTIVHEQSAGYVHTGGGSTTVHVQYAQNGNQDIQKCW